MCRIAASKQRRSLAPSRIAEKLELIALDPSDFRTSYHVSSFACCLAPLDFLLSIRSDLVSNQLSVVIDGVPTPRGFDPKRVKKHF